VLRPPPYDSVDWLADYNETPTRRCQRCPAEYKVTIKGQREYNGTVVCELEIARWMDLGRYRDVLSEEFMAFTGQLVGTRDWSKVESMRNRVLKATAGKIEST